MFLLKFSLTLIRAFQKLRFCQSRQFLSYAWRRLFASATPSAFMQAQASVCHPLRPLSRAPEIINVEIFGIVLLFNYQSSCTALWATHLVYQISWSLSTTFFIYFQISFWSDEKLTVLRLSRWQLVYDIILDLNCQQFFYLFLFYMRFLLPVLNLTRHKALPYC